MAAARIAQTEIVVRGLLALKSPMRRTKRFMVRCS
jgi:hypothetical protein